MFHVYVLSGRSFAREVKLSPAHDRTESPADRRCTGGQKTQITCLIGLHFAPRPQAPFRQSERPLAASALNGFAAQRRLLGFRCRRLPKGFGRCLRCGAYPSSRQIRCPSCLQRSHKHHCENRVSGMAPGQRHACESTDQGLFALNTLSSERSDVRSAGARS